jgi:regulator of protease activity HflC (stomatin/prohibitin superfamily)
MSTSKIYKYSDDINDTDYTHFLNPKLKNKLEEHLNQYKSNNPNINNNIYVVINELLNALIYIDPVHNNGSQLNNDKFSNVSYVQIFYIKLLDESINNTVLIDFVNSLVDEDDKREINFIICTGNNVLSHVINNENSDTISIIKTTENDYQVGDKFTLPNSTNLNYIIIKKIYNKERVEEEKQQEAIAEAQQEQEAIAEAQQDKEATEKTTEEEAKQEQEQEATEEAKEEEESQEAKEEATEEEEEEGQKNKETYELLNVNQMANNLEENIKKNREEKIKKNIESPSNTPTQNNRKNITAESIPVGNTNTKRANFENNQNNKKGGKRKTKKNKGKKVRK